MSHLIILRSAHTVYLSIFCGSKNKQRLFPYTALTNWFSKPISNPLKPSGYYMYRQLLHSIILRSAHTVYLCVLCGSQNKQRLFSYTALTDWFSKPISNPLKPSGYYMYRQLLHSVILRSAHTVYLSIFCGSENKQRLFPYTALTDWFL